ncbi:MFS transporter [Sphingomonas paeninsulae]|uniref:MFS transporter n=1 Tax=Sphingomonas paeninsulae TaxID=2319844 RepID=A0A494TDY0_SPHPE|nr:MFS transporter [Sphingomonas paeninsulae]AYJ87707.1 MFS transporter [Sphingomonas paeninsulae]
MHTRDVPPDRHLQFIPSSGASVNEDIHHTSKTGWAALLSGANGVRSLALAGGVALHAINVYIATTILPSVVRDIGGLDLYAWNTTVFVIASILGSALSAKLLQQTGPRGAYAIAATMFAFGALICAVSPSMPIMLIGRLVQGFGGGFLIALAYAMIRLVFDEALWPRAMALVSGMWGVGTLVGPAVGGIFAELGIWRAAFWSLAPVAILFGLLAATVLPKRDVRATQRSSVPFAQLALLMASILAISAGSTSSDLTRNIIGIVAAVVLTVLLINVEGRARQKLLPLGSFHPTTAIAALYATMSLLAITVTSSEIFVPLFLQVLHHQSPLWAGFLAALMAAGWTLGSITSAGASGRSVSRMITIGPLLGLVGMAALTVLLPKASGGTWLALTPICLALFGIGLGVGLAWPHLLTRVLKVTIPSEQELAAASITTIQLFATAMGAAVAGLVVNAGGLIDPGGTEGTTSAASWLFGTFTLAPLLCLVSARRVAKA